MNRIWLILILIKIRKLITDEGKFEFRDNLIRIAVHVMRTQIKGVQEIRRLDVAR